MWVQFFKEASIPAQYVQSYAHKFTENRIRFDMLPDLDRQLLNELGISAIGDCLSILKHAKTWTPTVNTYNRPFFILNLETSFQWYSLQYFTCRFLFSKFKFRFLFSQNRLNSCVQLFIIASRHSWIKICEECQDTFNSGRWKASQTSDSDTKRAETNGKASKRNQLEPLSWYGFQT